MHRVKQTFFARTVLIIIGVFGFWIRHTKSAAGDSL